MNVDVESQIRRRYPDVHLASDVQGWVYLEEFQKGIDCFHSLIHPTGADKRWLGVCYFQQFEDGKALEAFASAVEKGELAARVNLAHLLQVSDRADNASEEMQKIDLARLEPYDQVFFLRVKSIHEENNGNLRESLRFSEEAWRRLQGLAEFEILAPSVLTQLGILHGRIGRAQRATWFLDRGIQLTRGIQQMKIKMRWATVVVAQGAVQRAASEIDSWNVSDAPEPIRVEKEWLLGEIAWLEERFDDAALHYQAAIALAAKNNVSYEEFLSQLALATLCAFRNLDGAGTALRRAQELISDKSDRLSYRFREVVVLQWQGYYTANHALEELARVAEGFGEMGLLQEQGWVRLHMATLKKNAGDATFREDMDALRALGHTLQNPRFLRREAVILPTIQPDLPSVE